MGTDIVKGLQVTFIISCQKVGLLRKTSGLIGARLVTQNGIHGNPLIQENGLQLEIQHFRICIPSAGRSFGLFNGKGGVVACNFSLNPRIAGLFWRRIPVLMLLRRGQVPGPELFQKASAIFFG
jgi:hypothetical protein